MSSDPFEAKQSLRATVRGVRAGLDATVKARASVQACARVLVLPELRSAKVVGVYASHGDELDAATALAGLHDRGLTVALPRVRGDDLDLVVVSGGDRLTPGYRGIPEPGGPAVDLGAVGGVVVPGVAFDLAGGRLGRGGGHFDRLLARLSSGCVRVGLCFSCQLVPHVPRVDHDEPVDLVVTERAVHRTRARAVV